MPLGEGNTGFVPEVASPGHCPPQSGTEQILLGTHGWSPFPIPGPMQKCPEPIPGKVQEQILLGTHSWTPFPVPVPIQRWAEPIPAAGTNPTGNTRINPFSLPCRPEPTPGMGEELALLPFLHSDPNPKPEFLLCFSLPITLGDKPAQTTWENAAEGTPRFVLIPLSHHTPRSSRMLGGLRIQLRKRR